MSGKTPDQKAFLCVSAGPEDLLICLHTAEVTGSIPVAPTTESPVQWWVLCTLAFSRMLLGARLVRVGCAFHVQSA